MVTLWMWFALFKVKTNQRDRPVSTEAVSKLDENLQTIEQSEIFRDFFDSERSRAPDSQLESRGF